MNRHKGIAILAAILIVLGLAYCSRNGTKTVPDVTGQTISEATQTLQKAGYYNQTLQDLDGNPIFSGTVTKQTPKAGTEQSTATKIILTLENEQTKTKAKTDKLNQVVNEIKGKNAVQAMNILEKEHLLGTVATKNGTNEGNLEQRIRDDDANGIEWDVTDATPHLDNDGSIDITVDTKANIDAAIAKQAQADKLDQKLSQASALATCRQYGNHLYPAGFKMHNFTGVLQPLTPVDDDTWYYKVAVDVTNIYGVKMKNLTCDCKVTGTTESPQVIEFNVY
mgnify:CR=1 FL=1|jgi:hypothetical protein